MFSEYASRFLAQSQSRVTSRPDEVQRTGRSRPSQQQGNPRQPSSRSFLRPSDPYRPGASQTSHFPFAPRSSVQQAPLFFSATDEFREEDDETEREREIADFYALQRSRRHFGDSNLNDSSELDESEPSGLESSPYNDCPGNGKGIKSSWRGEEYAFGARPFPIESVAEIPEHEPAPRSSSSSSKVRGHLVDVGLEDSLRADFNDSQALSSPGAHDPPVQRFRERKQLKGPSGLSQHEAAVEPAELSSQDAPRPPQLSKLVPSIDITASLRKHST
ncbi:uncharacterized protein N7500_006545 [Penicillium coprophilum]|uniref:uncharacterized protein n=1 Tax=Penicillium coprophilum TaxID=36646 RepID=UPI0023A354B5|nr:uncharacterized protein N7500_006545 [Penicillium coprophilum]KAJ5164715.1 hypothetical protein N7500_006545 [Penicillium coprophilum]